MTLFASDLYFPSLLVLWLAVAVDALWRWPQSTHPLTFMRYLIRQMGQKVLPSDNYAAGQHYISGALAAIVLLSPLVICLAVLVYMAEYPVFFEAVIMVSLLDFGYQRQQYKKVMACVGRNKKSLAREMVKTITARQCHALTDIGIAKAAIESLYLKFLYLYCGVIFYFVVFGPIAALVYRLLLLTSWQWHYREKGMHHFALPVRKLVSVLVLPPAIFGAFATLVVTNPIKGIAAMQINLGFLRKVNRDIQTDRSVEIPACGGFMLAEYSTEHSLLFKEGVEAVFYRNQNELAERQAISLIMGRSGKLSPRRGVDAASKAVTPMKSECVSCFLRRWAYSPESYF